jgi:hypothetical protein
MYVYLSQYSHFFQVTLSYLLGNQLTHTQEQQAVAHLFRRPTYPRGPIMHQRSLHQRIPKVA